MFSSLKKAALLPVLLVTFAAMAQDYPNKPVRIVVASAAGGPVDVAARTIGQKLSDLWRQPVIIENKAGASEIIGAEYVAKSAPDGYTLLVTSLNPMTINPAVFAKLPYDPVKSFASITSITVNPMVLVANPKAPFNSIKELVAVSKQRPDGISWSTPGLNTGNHIAGEWFASETGAKMVHVPYKGGPAAVNAVIAGDVPLGIVSLVNALPFVKAGSLKALAVTTGKRTPLAPDWPTIAELAVPGFDAAVYAAMFASAATPRAIVMKINADVNRILQMPEIKERFATMGAEAVASTPEELDTTIARLKTKIAKIVADAKITVQ